MKLSYLKLTVFYDIVSSLLRKVLFLLFCMFAFSGMAQSITTLTAVDDTLRTGPLQWTRKDIISNDIILGDNYRWKILSSLPPSVGIIAKHGDYLFFVPSVNCRDTAFTILYELSGNNLKDTANVCIIVSKYNNPVNVTYSDLKCVSEMSSGVNFNPVLKYIGKKSENTDYHNDDRLDGFSMPLVGDLNGDNKPEIIAMGISDGDGLSGTGDKIIILNGQTGTEIYRYPLSNLGGDYRLRYEPRHNSISKLAIADLDRNGIGDIIVTEVGSSGQVHCIEPVYSGTTIVGMKKKWTGWTGNTSTIASFKAPLSTNNNKYGSPLPYIADLNADGSPEVIVYNKIYDGVTGKLVCTLETLNGFGYNDFQGTGSSDIKKRNNIIDNYAYVGRRPGAAWQDDYIPCMAIADINGDGILDIIAGSKVYIMMNKAGTPALNYIIKGPSSITAQKGTGTSEKTTYVTDGFTAVADIDLDGYLEVIVLAPATNSLDASSEHILYVWTPLKNPTTPKAATYLYTASSTGTMSYPFVGDINGRLDDYTGTKRLPEICFNGGRFYVSNTNSSNIAFHPMSSNMLSSVPKGNSKEGFNYSSNSSVRGHIIGFTYHAAPNGLTPLHHRLKLAWAMEQNDESTCTGISMFDFDNDNIKELCYRDENSVRVISPARLSYIYNTEPVSSTGAVRFKYTGIGSYTGFEAPVIADVNMDGSADIVTLVHDKPNGSHSKGFIHVFEHAPGTDMWAPCPPVWNQGIYFPLQINEDLTVPAKTQSMLTPYEDVNGNTIYPYNGQWIQQPIVKLGEKYVPQVRKPDAILLNMEISVTSTSSASVKLTIRNGGSASINAQTPITFYDGGSTGLGIGQGATRIGTQSVGVDIFPDEKVTRTYTIRGNFNNKLVWARIVDNGAKFPASGFLECESNNNTFSATDCPYLIYTVTASPDTVLCSNTDNVLLNVVPTNPPRYTPTYQWYRNDVLIPGADTSIYTATMANEYKCYVTENICRGFSSVKILTRDIPVAVDDSVSLITGAEVIVDVLLNDHKSVYCTLVPEIVKNSNSGSVSVVGDKIKYKSEYGYTGKDTLIYKIDDSEASVFFTVNPLPVDIFSDNKDTVICAGVSFNFSANYTDDGTFGNNLVCRWEHNTGNIHNPKDWKVISGTEKMSGTGIVNNVYTVNTVALSDSGYYRLAIVNPANNSNENGLAYSNAIQLIILPVPVASVETKELCPEMTSKLFSKTDTNDVWVSDNPKIAEIDGSIVKAISEGKAILTYTSTATGCSQSFEIEVKSYPDVEDIEGKKRVCVNEEVVLSCKTPDGVWTHNNSNISLSKPTTNPATVTVTGVSTGKSFVTYTVSNGICQTKSTFSLIIIDEKTPPKIRIGIQRK